MPQKPFYIPESFVVLFNDAKLVNSLVDNREVFMLHLQEVLLHQGEVTRNANLVTHAGVVQMRRHLEQEVVKQERVFIEVEVDSAVVDFRVGALGENLLVQLMLPALGGMLNHQVYGVVELRL